MLLSVVKNNTRDSNVVPHRSTNIASSLTLVSRREPVFSSGYGRFYIFLLMFYL